MAKWGDLTEAQKSECTKTALHEGRFWSGATNSDGNWIGGPVNAKSLAEADGGKTLEMKLKENGVEMPSYFNADGSVNAEAEKAWKEASASYEKVLPAM